MLVHYTTPLINYQRNTRMREVRIFYDIVVIMSYIILYYIILSYYYSVIHSYMLYQKRTRCTVAVWRCEYKCYMGMYNYREVRISD